VVENNQDERLTQCHAIKTDNLKPVNIVKLEDQIMIAPLKQPTRKKTIKLLPQEKEGQCQFSGKFVATRNAIEKFREAVIFAAYATLQKQVEKKSGLDYLQVFEIDGERLWFIDDVTHVTCLLPSDY